jgi:hypothetical protein
MEGNYQKKSSEAHWKEAEEEKRRREEKAAALTEGRKGKFNKKKS